MTKNGPPTQERCTAGNYRSRQGYALRKIQNSFTRSTTRCSTTFLKGLCGFEFGKSPKSERKWPIYSPFHEKPMKIQVIGLSGPSFGRSKTFGRTQYLGPAHKRAPEMPRERHVSPHSEQLCGARQRRPRGPPWE